MKIGIRYKEVMIALNGYKTRLVEYIETQKSEGYILRHEDISSMPTSDFNDTVTFKMGHHSFLVQFICVNHYATILIQLFIKTRFPEPPKYLRIPEMDVVCENVSDRYAGIARFTTDKIVKNDWDREETITYLQDFNVEYFEHIERYIKTLYVPRRRES